MDNEEWRKAVEDYEISNLGNVRRCIEGCEPRIIRGSIITTTGYKYFQLQREGKRYNHFFHVLVCQAFLGPRPKGAVIDHIDRNKLNNCLTNLRYCSPEENSQNSARYKSHITEKDKSERARILRKEWAEANKERMKLYKRIYNAKKRIQKFTEEYERLYVHPKIQGDTL